MNAVLQALESHREQGTYRKLQQNQGRVDFSSNDYLGLSRSGNIRTKLIQALESGSPLGATGSRLLSGETECHERVEAFLANAFSAPSALLFSSGFLANLGVLSVFGSLGAYFFSDELNHASLVDGMKHARSERAIFRHNDLGHLEELLAVNPSRLKVIVTESVFSMDGDLSPLRELLGLAERYEAWLILDEAHATGIFGATGLGRLEGISQHREKLISIHTGGKALGGQGAFVLSDRNFRELLINRARSFIFSTALSPLSALQIEFALEEIQRDSKQGERLLQKSRAWKESLPMELRALPAASQIIPIPMGSNAKALSVANSLQALGLDARAIRSPSVPQGSERLRITLKSFHSGADLQKLARALVEFA